MESFSVNIYNSALLKQNSLVDVFYWTKRNFTTILKNKYERRLKKRLSISTNSAHEYDLIIISFASFHIQVRAISRLGIFFPWVICLENARCRWGFEELRKIDQRFPKGKSITDSWSNLLNIYIIKENLPCGFFIFLKVWVRNSFLRLKIWQIYFAVTEIKKVIEYLHEKKQNRQKAKAKNPPKTKKTRIKKNKTRTKKKIIIIYTIRQWWIWLWKKDHLRCDDRYSKLN